MEASRYRPLEEFDREFRAKHYVDLLKRRSDRSRTMLTKYLKAAMRHAQYEILPDVGQFYGEIPECNGVYATAISLKSCRDQLGEALDEWGLFRVYRNSPNIVRLRSLRLFSKWDQIFKDAMTTAAAIDRLVHHSVIIELNVPSFRVETAKTKKSRGQFQSKTPATSNF